MVRLVSSEVLNAPNEDVILSIPAGGVFILKQLLAQYISWDVDDSQQIDVAEAVLAKTIALEAAEVNPLPKLVFAGSLSADFVIVPNAEGFLEWTPNLIDSEYATYTSQLTLVPGRYQFFHTIRVSAYTTGATNWFHRFRVKTNSGQIRVWEGLYGDKVHVPTYTYFAGLNNPPPVFWTWQQFSGADCGILAFSDSTRIEVYKIE